MKGRKRKRNDDTRIEVRDARVTNWSWFENEAMDRYAKEIGPYAWMVYCYLIRRADKDGQSYPSYKTIAKDLGIGRTSVYNAVNVLQAKGLVDVEERIDELSGDPTSHIYTVLGVSPDEPPHALNESPCAAERTGVYHDVNPNNTHVNKIQEQEGGSSTESISRDMALETTWQQMTYGVTFPRDLAPLVARLTPRSWADGCLVLHGPSDVVLRLRRRTGELLERLQPVAPMALREVVIVNGQ